MLLHIAQATEKTFGSRSGWKKTFFFVYAILQYCKSSKKKRLVKLTRVTEHSEFNSFTNMVSIIDIDALEIQEQIKN